MKNFILALAIVGVTAVGLKALPAQALTANDIQAQIQALLAQINVLTAQLNALKGNDISSQGVHSGGDPLVGTGIDPLPSKHRVCYLLSRNLGAGSQGDDVRGLQEYLQENGYLSVAPTGYYGPVTAGAVAKWQSSEGVSAVGSFGPMSRERLKIWCGGNQNRERFNASPTTGSAPLSVTFNTWLSGFRVNTISYTIDYGDGTSERAADCPAPADACTGPGQNTHTYTQNGVYTATLNKITDPCPDDGDPNTPRCMAAIHQEVVGKIQINVGSVACTKEYRPVCGAKPIVCITTPCNPVPTTYSNTCMMNADGATLLYEGQCRDTSADPAANPQCKTWYDGCNTCSRSTPGGPAMCTLKACYIDSVTSASAMYRPYCTSYFDSTSTNKPPVISSFSGPTTLALNTNGTWTISASDPENGSLSYKISWGDAYDLTGNSAASPSSLDTFVQTTSFTHSYSHAGTYTVIITVRDQSGATAQTTTTVRVGSIDGVACTADAYQCPNGQWVGRSGPQCQFVCPTSTSSAGGNDSSSVSGCSFSTTAVGSMCGGYYHCATGANYHYWSGTYSPSCIAGR